MAERRPQNLQNHVRLDPAYHFFLLPLSVLMFLASVWNAIRGPDFVSLWLILGSLLFVVAAGLIRTYPLKVQDRVIRLEERLRMASLLPASQHGRIDELTEGQVVALRFASDAELPALMEKTLKEKLKPADIKKLIREWRPDYWRV